MESRWGGGTGFDFESDFLVFRRDFFFFACDVGRQADELHFRFSFKRCFDFEFGFDFGFGALFERGPFEGAFDDGFDDFEVDELGAEEGVSFSKIGVADDADFPFLECGIAVGADGDCSFGGLFFDFLNARCADSVRGVNEVQVERFIEPFLAVNLNLELHLAIPHERNFGLDEFQGDRKFLRDGGGEGIFNHGVERALIAVFRDVYLVLDSVDERRGCGVLGSELEPKARRCEGSVGCGFEDHRDGVGGFVDGAEGRLHACWEALGFEGDSACPVAAFDAHHGGVTVSSWNHDRAAVLRRVDGHFRQRCGHFGLHFRDFSAVAEGGTATALLVAHGEEEGAVGGRSPAQVAVGPVRVVVTAERGSFFIQDRNDGVSSRTKGASEHADVECFPFFSGELEVIDIGSVVDDAVECGGKGDGFSGDLGDGVIRFGFEHVGDIDDADVDWGWSGLTVFIDDAVERVIFRGELHDFFARSGDITIEGKLLILIGLAAEGEGGDGAREGADAHEVVAFADT